MPLRSFRPPANRCAHCGELQDPYLPRSNFGCLALTPIAIALPLASGYIALQLGGFLAPVVQIAGFDILLAILTGFDVLALVCIVHVKRFRSPSQQQHAGLVTFSLMYLVIGMRSARGMGLDVAIWTGLINTIFASAVTIGILRLVKPPPEAPQITK